MIDPKPQLSRAAIEANIEYYKSICEKHRQAHADALEQLIKWETKLMNIKLTTEQQQIIDQIKDLYQELNSSSDRHYTLQQWIGLVSVEAQE